MAKYKVGDTVRIRSKEWIDAQEKDGNGGIVRNDSGNTIIMVWDMQTYAGKEAVIREVSRDGSYRISLGWIDYWWADWMFEDLAEPEILSNEEAARAMLDREVLVDCIGNNITWKDGWFVTWREGDKEPHPPYNGTFCGLRRLPAKRKRPASRWEVLGWANSEESRGWVVRRGGGYSWVPPQCLAYDENITIYQRARLLPDFSGVDESTIQGFEVKE
jgi:hypothetical protein